MTLLDLIKIDYNINLGGKRGARSNIYLATYNNVKFAVKYKKIDDNDYKEIINNKYGEYPLVHKLNDKYCNLFMTLYDYKLANNYKFDKSLYDYTKKSKKFLDTIIESPYTIIELWTYVDNILPLIPYLKKIYLNCIKQLAYIFYILSLHDCIYVDCHKYNIGIQYTNNKFILIKNNKIKTYGNKVILLDYDPNCLKISSWPSETNTIKHTYYYLLIQQPTLNIFYDCNNFEIFYKKYLDFNNILYNKNFKISLKKKEIIKSYLPILTSNEINKNIEKLLYKILFTKHFQKTLLHNNYIKYIKFNYYISKKHILFIIKNLNDTRQILYYLLLN
jgi:hypothetical protein